jgi:2-phosphosulfolactate phosphatase
MMTIDVVRIPSEAQPGQIRDQVVVVFDVLRATTSMVTAISAGASEIRVFGSLEDASQAASEFHSSKLLCGEQNCLAPPGFDLGNSPGEFTSERVAGRTIFFSTTNGTRAIVASQQAKHLFVASLVNAKAMAHRLLAIGEDVTLFCSGTGGEFAPEDMIGAGAVIDHLLEAGEIPISDTATEALHLFRDIRDKLLLTLRASHGGRNILRAGLGADIDFAARLDVFDVVIEVSGNPPVARRMIQST